MGTQSSDLFSAQTLIDRVRGRLKRKNALIGSPLARGGAIRVLPTMPKGGKGAINKTIDVPYYGVLPPFQPRAENAAAVPQKVAQTSEQATVGCSSLAVETSILAQAVAAGTPELGDPHQEAADQAGVQAEREMDRLAVEKFVTTPLIVNAYHATNPVYISHRLVVQARTKWGDEQDDIVGMVVHSQTLADLATLYNAKGEMLLTENVTEGQEGVLVRRTFAGVPLSVSDSASLNGSTMGSVTSEGTSAPVATLTGTPTGPWELVIDCVLGGAHQTATYRFSTDGGNTWSATITTLAAGVAQPLTDPAVDSLVGNNGETGVSVAFAAGTFNADNAWKAKANLCCNTLICQADAGIFWYSADHLRPKTDEDILEDTDIFALHLYHVMHMYRRRRMGTRCGVVNIKHNVRGFTG